MASEVLLQRIKASEGFRAKPYRCPAGKMTIGYGRNLEDVGITEAEAENLLRHDIVTAEFEVIRAWPWARQNLSQFRFEALVDMAFNMGITRLAGFKNMIAALQRGDYDAAAAEMLNSKWARQVGNRANVLAEIMRTGEV